MKKYSLMLTVTLVLILAACGKESSSSNVVAEAEKEPIATFNDQVVEWADEIKYVIRKYKEEYKIERIGPYGKTEGDDEKVNGLNTLRSEWTLFCSEMDWNVTTTSEQQILSTIKDMNFSLEKMLEYKASYLNSRRSSDYDMMNMYARDFDDKMNYLQAQTGATSN